MTTTTDTISGATLKVTLGGLGLPPSWFASRMNVTMRTVVRWFDGDDVAPNVAAELAKLSELAVESMLKMIEKIGDVDIDDTVTLKTYRTDPNVVGRKAMPASWHRMLTFRVAEHLRAQGATVLIEYR